MEPLTQSPGHPQAEVDILGVDGVLYKGRMSNQFGARIGDKDLAGEEHWCFLGFPPWDPALLARTRGFRWTPGWCCPWLRSPHSHLQECSPHYVPGTRKE